MKLKTPLFRASYPHILKRSEGKEGFEPIFSVNMLFSTEAIKADKAQLERWNALKAAVDAAVKEGFPKLYDDWKAGKPVFKYPLFVKAEEKLTSEGEPIAGYEKGWIVAKASNRKSKPDARGPSGQPNSLEEDDIYPGMWAQAVVSPYTYNVSGNRGVALVLLGFQKIRDEEPLGGSKATDDDFDAISDTEAAKDGFDDLL